MRMLTTIRVFLITGETGKRDSENAPFPMRCINMTHERHNSGIINDPSSEFRSGRQPY